MYIVVITMFIFFFFVRVVLKHDKENPGYVHTVLVESLLNY